MARTRSAVVAVASVIVKWFVNEHFSDESLRLRKDHAGLRERIVVPGLARYEVLNALKYSGRFGSKELLQIALDLQHYQFLEVFLDGTFGEAAAMIASDYGITIYDSSYLEVGRVRDLTVFTADEKVPYGA
ncbi:MAG: type II toxin-antitoxin system VapC family toxin [Nitrososphaerales archaeon]